MTRLYLSCLLLIATGANAQDSAFTYTRILQADNVSKNDLYDRALIWCSKSFTDVKGAINVKDKESGIIAGKGLLKNYYKIPRKKDSVGCFMFVDYYFDWLIEIKDNKARLSLKNIEVQENDINYPVTNTINPPVKIMFQSQEKQQLIWDLSKKSFIRYMDIIAGDLNSDMNKKADSW